MQDRTTDELHIVVNHVPHGLIAASHPVVVVDGFVTIDVDKVLAFGSKIAVHLRCRDNDVLVLGKAACSLFDNREDDRQHLVELVLEHIENLFLNLVNLLPQGLTFVVVERLNFGLDAVNLVAFVLHSVAQLLSDVGSALSQCVIVQGLNLGIGGLDAINNGHQLFQVTVRLGTDQ